MSEWEVVGILITLLGLIITVVSPLLKLNSTIVKLTSQMEYLLDELTEFKQSYKERLVELDHTDETLLGRLDDHEHRLIVLENRKE